jgi:uncharacterized protein YabE (DUF348 family)/3D (Asp-Asp-Asp) domain-containing protein
MRYAWRLGLRRVTETLRSRSVALSLLACLVVLVFFQFITSLNLYVIFDGDSLTVHQSYAEDAHIALAEAGISLNRDDYVYLPESVGGVVEIHIVRTNTVYLDVYGEELRLSTVGGTVGEALTRAGYAPGGQDVVEPDLATPIEGETAITVWRRETRLETETEEIPFEIERLEKPSLLIGKEETVQEGEPGLKTYTYEVSLRNGVVTDRRRVAETVSLAPQNTVINYGTKKPTPPPAPASITIKSNPVLQPYGDGVEGGSMVIPSGETLYYKKVLNVSATAYTTEGYTNKLTATGAVARVGIIAVDPRVIPLGTKVYVEIPGGQFFYGLAVCGDTGGAIKGNIIDLFFNTTAECWKFGRRPAIVYILDY